MVLDALKRFGTFLFSSSRPQRTQEDEQAHETNLHMEEQLKAYRHKYDVLNRWSSRKNSRLLHDPDKIELFLRRVKMEYNTFEGLFIPEERHLPKHLQREGKELLEDYKRLIQTKEELMRTSRKAA